MKVLSSKADVDLIYTKACELIQTNKALPDNVFNSTFKHFLFIPFDGIRMPYFLIITSSTYWILGKVSFG